VHRTGTLVLTLSSTPGVLIDGNAPPPPPGQPPARHPFLSGACSGDAPSCSQAGELLRASSSLDDFLNRLRANGFDVQETTGRD
jgi:hypothetical protein